MKSLRHLLPVVAVAGLAACASTSDDSKIAYKSAEAPKRTLEVPPDLTAPELTNSYAMPAGGVSAKLHKFSPMITTKAPVVAASFLNQAGIVGAALFAEKELTKR